VWTSGVPHFGPKDDIIKSRGEKVSLEVENVLYDLEGVAETAVGCLTRFWDTPSRLVRLHPDAVLTSRTLHHRAQH
jgi:acyl-coenzyme A synthetase/AMP-(fatty) acid ligase